MVLIVLRTDSSFSVHIYAQVLPCSLHDCKCFDLH